MRIYSPEITGSLIVSGSIIPGSNELYDLGTPTKRFKDLYLSGSTIYLGNIQLKESDGKFVAVDNLGTPISISGSLTGSLLGTSTTASYVDFSNIDNKPTLISSSAQLASDISGSFGQISSSFSTRISDLEIFSSSLSTTENVYSGSFSGSFIGDGSQLSGVTSYTDQDTLNYINSINVVSGSTQVNHDNTTGFVSNEHIDHSTVTLTAGDGLSGGGDITTGRTFDVDSTVVRTSGNQTIAGTKTFSNNITIQGDLLVTGTTTTVNSTTVSIADNLIEINGSGAANGGILVKDVTSPGTVSGSLFWDGTNNYWKAGGLGSENRILTVADEGSGNGIDADTLDGNQATAFYLATNPSGYTTNTGTVTSVGTGTGLTGGTIITTGTIAHADTSTQASVNNSGRTFIQDITLDDFGHVTGITSATDSDTYVGTVTSVATGTGLTGGTITTTGTISLSHLGFQNLTDPNADRVAFWDDSAGAFAWLSMGSNLSITGTTLNATDTNTTYSAGNGISLSGTTFSVAAGGGLTQDASGLSHSDTSTQASVNNSGRTFIQDITLDTYGHVTAITSATDSDTYVGTVTSVATGTGLTGGTITSTGTISHSDTSTLSGAYGGSADGIVIEDITVDGLGHVTAVGTVDLDGRFVQKNTGYEWTSTGGNALSFRSLDVLETSTSDQASIEIYQDTAGADAFMQFHIAGDYAVYFGLKGDINDLAVGGWSMGNTYYRIWHSGNDGAGSGLDADTLDGNQATAFYLASNPSGYTTNTGTVTSVGVSAGNGLTGGGTVTTSGTVTLNVGAGTGIDVSADAIAVDVSDFMTNGSNNRVVTATGTDGMNAEANLTFDGSTLSVTGTVSATTITETSAREKKENIESLDSALDSVMKLNPVTFNFKESDRKEIGFIADEVNEVYPEFVSDNVDAVSYSKIVAVLTKSIQELNERLIKLENGNS